VGLARHRDGLRQASLAAIFQRKERRVVTMEGYCVKCRAKRDIKDPEHVVLKNGRPAMKGTCPVCGTKMMRFLKKSE